MVCTGYTGCGSGSTSRTPSPHLSVVSPPWDHRTWGFAAPRTMAMIVFATPAFATVPGGCLCFDEVLQVDAIDKLDICGHTCHAIVWHQFTASVDSLTKTRGCRSNALPRCQSQILFLFKNTDYSVRTAGAPLPSPRCPPCRLPTSYLSASWVLYSRPHRPASLYASAAFTHRALVVASSPLVSRPSRLSYLPSAVAGRLACRNGCDVGDHLLVVS